MAPGTVGRCIGVGGAEDWLSSVTRPDAPMMDGHGWIAVDGMGGYGCMGQ